MMVTEHLRSYQEQRHIMKATLLAASLLALSASAFATDVGVSINIGQPGFYGRIDIGDYPQPQVLYRQPIIVERPVHYVERAPIYLRVPPGHAKKWSKHCGKYNACNQRVYFVQDSWYTNEYAPRYRDRHAGPDRRDHRDDHRDDHGHGKGKGHDKDKDKGHGNGKGHGRD